MNESTNDTVAILEEGGPKQPKRRGRKPLNNNFEFPKEDFKIKDLATKYNVSVPYIHLKIKAAGADVEKIGVEKVPGVRGKCPTVYRFVGKRATEPTASI